MEAFLEYVVKGFVQNPDDVSITPVERNGLTIYELRLNQEDVGRIIGKQGVTINAIRNLLTAGSARKGIRCSVEIVEEDAEIRELLAKAQSSDTGDLTPEELEQEVTLARDEVRAELRESAGARRR